MSAFTVRLPDNVAKKLDELAEKLERSRSYVAAQAIERLCHPRSLAARRHRSGPARGGARRFRQRGRGCRDHRQIHEAQAAAVKRAVRWTRRARRRLENIGAHIEADNPAAAARVVGAIALGIQRLARAPGRGRARPQSRYA